MKEWESAQPQESSDQEKIRDLQADLALKMVEVLKNMPEERKEEIKQAWYELEKVIREAANVKGEVENLLNDQKKPE